MAKCKHTSKKYKSYQLTSDALYRNRTIHTAKCKDCNFFELKYKRERWTGELKPLYFRGKEAEEKYKELSSSIVGSLVKTRENKGITMAGLTYTDGKDYSLAEAHTPDENGKIIDSYYLMGTPIRRLSNNTKVKDFKSEMTIEIAS